MTRLLLIGLLTVLSFSVFADFNENPLPPYVPPESKPVIKYDFFVSKYSLGGLFVDIQTGLDFVKSNYSRGAGYTLESCEIAFDTRVKCSYKFCNAQGGCTSGSDLIGTITQRSINSETCPPDSYPDYILGPNPIDPLNPSGPKACFPKFKPCPLGFFKNEVTLSNGESKCVPVSCPNKGTRVNNVFNKNGAIGVGSSGTYCDGKCSYTIQPTDAPYNGSSFVFGTSNGAVCGQGQDKDIKFTPTDKEGTCTTSQLSTGANFQTCTEGDGTAPEEDNAEGELDDKAQDASVDPLTKPSKYQGADCSITADQLYCVGTEIIEALDHQTAETKKQQDEKHNKLVELQKDISEYVENQQRDRFTKQSSQSQTETSLILGGLSEITTAIKTGSGSGTGGGDGGSDDSLTEEYNPDSQQVDDAFSQSRSDIESAASDLDSQLDTHKAFYSPESNFWDSFQGISDLLPSDVACTNPDIDFKELHMTIDLCSKADLIKAFLGFAMIFATLFRVLYQTQTVLRIVAESKA